MDAYCQRQGLASTNVRFLFDGERLHEAQTPKELNMENGDEIDVLVEQVGGSCNWPNTLERLNDRNSLMFFIHHHFHFTLISNYSCFGNQVKFMLIFIIWTLE